MRPLYLRDGDGEYAVLYAVAGPNLVSIRRCFIHGTE